MRSQFLEFMSCPYCGSEFKFQVVVEKNGEDITFGCIRCECSEFPVVEGILILKAGPLSRRVVKLIKERKTREATIHCFGWEDFRNLYESYVPFLFSYKLQTALGKILSFLGYKELYKKNAKVYRDYADKRAPFGSIVEKDAFGMYLKNRFSTFSFWSSYACIPLLKAKRARILDLSCGAGHWSFVVDKYVRPDVHCCSDSSYRLLFLAKKYFARNAEFVCHDANDPLPFKDDSFDSILMADAFDCVYGRAYLAREMERTLAPKGLLLLTHLHNSLAYKGTFGYPLSPQSYAALFSEKLDRRMISERRLVENFLFDNKLNLEEKHSDEELNSSIAVTLVATEDQSLFTIYDGLDHDFLSMRSNLVINPLYEVKEHGDSLLLVRSPTYNKPPFSFEDYYTFTKDYLPSTYEISKRFVGEGTLSISNFQKADELMKKFVLINVPENYIDRSKKWRLPLGLIFSFDWIEPSFFYWAMPGMAA